MKILNTITYTLYAPFYGAVEQHVYNHLADKRLSKEKAKEFLLKRLTDIAPKGLDKTTVDILGIETLALS